jgi:hypothetical protein
MNADTDFNIRQGFIRDDAPEFKSEKYIDLRRDRWLTLQPGTWIRNRRADGVVLRGG